MGKSHKQGIPFEWEGRFLGFVPSSDGKLKYLRWQTGSDLFTGKIPKPIRSELYRTLRPGDAIQIWGEREVDLRKGQEKWVLYRVVPSPAQSSLEPALQTGSSAGDPSPKPKGTVLVCQKSDCCRRGAGEVIQALKTHLATYPDAIRVQGVGCMKECKRGPNVVFMPDKARYSGVSAQGIPALLERHFPSPSEPSAERNRVSPLAL
ncbi:(2Fe-2S) ferredoxin domain-containing protein [Synechococcus sp. Nb3U1]|uniref:(2Fe-2S) ferredoxin domain-containing protein n=1 Tax=Synechococcus sp. Nb3U1 TaxID=1914529 RepID=UPI001F424C08|nr:(2Fe-2S) ferredoxin domain-containing protein [Synechococcus sp. Nb3U1]MCF2971596.1 (2Fe-2S) ferredoxin domain-containing protein [Synechococcus sp. Nb3U1]